MHSGLPAIDRELGRQAAGLADSWYEEDEERFPAWNRNYLRLTEMSHNCTEKMDEHRTGNQHCGEQKPSSG